VFIDWLDAAKQMRSWVERCLERTAPGSSPPPRLDVLALLLAPKTGKTHAMVRVLRPLIYEVFKDREPTPDVIYLDLTSISLPNPYGAPAADLETTFQDLYDSIADAARRQGAQVPEPPPSAAPKGRLQSLVKLLGERRPTFFLLDEIGRLVQGPREQAMRVLDVFKGLTKLKGVHFAIAGSGMVHFLAQLIDQGAHGFHLFDIIYKLDLSARVTEPVSRFAAERLVDRYKGKLNNHPEMDAATLYTMGQLCVSLNAQPHPALLHFLLREYLADASVEAGWGDRVIGAVRRTQEKFQRDFRADRYEQ